MLCAIRTWACLGCRQLALRSLSSGRGHHKEEKQDSEKEFRPKKALLVRKVTRYEYEKFYLKPELNETQLQEYVRFFVVVFEVTVLTLPTDGRAKKCPQCEQCAHWSSSANSQRGVIELL